MSEPKNCAFLFVVLLICAIFLSSTPGPCQESQSSGIDKKNIRVTNLEECIKIALKNNQNRLVSQSAIEIAESQHKQALSAYWPRLEFKAAAVRLDENPNFIFPGMLVSYGPFSIPVPEQHVELMDKNLLSSSLNFIFPIYTGGRIGAISKQAEMGVKAAKESARKSDLQIVFDVKRMYYGSILGAILKKLSTETLQRLEVTLDLTDRLYKTGSGKVKKTDYLRTNIIVSNIKALDEVSKSNEELAKAALINAMGLDWNTQIEIAETEIPYNPYNGNLEKLVSDMYQFSPDWAKLQIGLDAAEAKIKEAKSGHLPILALTGTLNNINNSYDKGLVTPSNVQNGIVGLALEFPLFSGFQTSNKVREAKARLEMVKEQKIIIREGLALQVKDVFLQISRAQGQVSALKESIKFAEDNRELNIRAYQDELVETRDVIEAQLLESFVNAQYDKALYDHMENRAKLDYVIGTEMEKTLQ